MNFKEDIVGNKACCSYRFSKVLVDASVSNRPTQNVLAALSTKFFAKMRFVHFILKIPS